MSVLSGSQSCLTLYDPVAYSLPGFSVHRDSPGKNTGVGLPSPPSGDLPNPWIELRFPTLQTDSLPSEPPGKTKNTGGSCLSLLQEIFSTWASTQVLLLCKQILYQLSYLGSPIFPYVVFLIFKLGWLFFSC